MYLVCDIVFNNCPEANAFNFFFFQMLRKCCVFGCRSNYDKASEVSAFKFSKDGVLRDKWIKKISRKDFTPTTHSVVCVKHFAEQFILREDRMTRGDGTVRNCC